MYTLVEPYENRLQAGRLLAADLESYRERNCIVLAIPRGGVVIGYEIATSLDFELDVIVPRKIGAPGQPELAIGAVVSWGDSDYLLDEHTVRILHVNEDYIRREVQRQIEEIRRRLQAYRGSTNPPNIAERTVILVDDGIATGYTMRAALLALKKLSTHHIVMAVPVGPPDTIDQMRSLADDVICPKTPYSFMAVGYWYREFEQVSDEEVIALLHKARARGSKY